jgi:tRNA threonylcarbamoyladenosine biosynthesis protein TsaB
MKKSDNSKRILTIETTSEICGVSIVEDNIILFENNINNGFNHSITLFDNIFNALEKCELEMKDINTIKVSNGPGSFTGIRIGVAAAIGLSEMYNTNIEYIDTLDSLSYNVHGKNDIIISMIDAKNDRVYIALYFSNGPKKICNDFIINVYDLCNELNKNFKKTNISFSIVGSGAVNYKKIFDKELKIKYSILKKQSSLKASSLAFVKGDKYNIPNINYLLSSKAERERNG